MIFSRFRASFSQAPRWFQWGWAMVALGILLLRFWDLQAYAWGYDELSAVFRAMQAKDWHAHLHQGVAVDGHPAGLQTLIWFWISANGADVFIPRFFTSVISVGVLWQLHGIAKRHFDVETAYWAVCLMGLMWWQAGMAIWIRPYIFALPFVLWSWDLVLGLLYRRDIGGHVLLPERWGWFAVKLGGALGGAAYIHYFAGLTAGASFIALLLLQPKIKPNPSEHTQGLHPSYILFLPVTVAFLLYLPHLPLTFAQFQLGGLGWLNAPTPKFLWQFLQHATGNSPAILLLFTGALIYAIQYHIRIAYLPKPASFTRILQQPTILLTLGFLLVFAFGYVYSVVRAPILQNNALYFSFPLIILVAASGITTLRNQLGDTQNGINRFEKNTRPFAILLPALLLFNTLYQKQFLTLERKGSHHRIVEQSLQFAENQTKSHQTRGTNSDLHLWLDGPADNYQFHKGQTLYKHKNSAIPPTVYFESAGPTLPFIAQQLQSLKPGAQVFLGLQSGSQPWLLPLIESHFNHTSRYQETSTSASQTDLAPSSARETSNNKENQKSSKPNPHDHEFLIGGEWLTLAEPRVPQFTPEDFHLAESQPVYNTADTTLLSTTIEVSDFNPSSNDVILIVVRATDCKGDIETSLWNQTQQIDWRSTHIADYQQAGFKYALHAIKLADIPGWNQQTLLRIRISSASHCLIGKYLGNPYLYGVQP
ncbi:MAG: hypothetical protein ACO27G_06140 [Bacteroidia bacterium]